MSRTSTILIVDDEALGREALAGLLQPQGYQLYLAASGFDALEQAATCAPDLVLLDVMMPGMDGFEVCRRLRADPRLRDVPVIMLTALDDRVSRLQGIEAGADDFISKPYDRIELRARVRTITRLNRYRRMLAERARFEWAVEHADDGYVIIAETGEILYTNPRARLYLGLEPDGNLPEIIFLELASKQYHCNPPGPWDDWFAPGRSAQAMPRYLVRPPSSSAERFMLQVDLLAIDAYPLEGHLIRLRDITASIVNQNAVWSFQGLVRHKLSTALSQVVGSLHLLESMNLVPVENTAAELFKMSRHGASQLNEQLQVIFRYIDAPDLVRPDHGRCSVAELLRSVAELCAGLELRSVSIDFNEGQDTGERWLGISRQGIDLALGELLENARKFHPQQSPAIEITIAASADQLHITVVDDGSTLSPEQLAKVWLPYYQGERYFTGQQAGMGLGLPMVAAMIWRIGGTCRISNRDTGSGVRVELGVPFVEPVDPFIDGLLVGAAPACLTSARIEA